jgi:hypothetical protein
LILGIQASYWKKIQSQQEHTSMENETRSDSSRFQDFGRKVDERFSETLPRVEDEVKRVIAFLNDEVVPHVRQNSSQALRLAAEQLNKLAEHLDRRRG